MRIASFLFLLVAASASAIPARPGPHAVATSIPSDVSSLSWSDYLDTIKDVITDVVETAKHTGADLWQNLADASKDILQSVKGSLVSAEKAVEALMKEVLPHLIRKIAPIVEFGKEELKFIGDLVVNFLKDFGQEAIKLGIKYWEEHQDEIVDELKEEAAKFLSDYILKKLKEYIIGEKRELVEYGWSDFWHKVGQAIDNAVNKVVATGDKLADKISEEFEKIKDQINNLVAPVKEKVRVVMEQVMPKIYEKSRIIFAGAKEVAKQVGLATLEILKKLGHDALIEAQKWLDENHELVEKMLFDFLTETLPKLIKDQISNNFSVAEYSKWTDFWQSVGESINTAVEKVKDFGGRLADAIANEYRKISAKISDLIAPIKEKVKIIMTDVMPQIMAKAKEVLTDLKERAKQTAEATLEMVKSLGHDALKFAQQWLDENHELVEELLWKFLTEILPELIKIALQRQRSFTDFWQKVGTAINEAVNVVVSTGKQLADAVAEQFNKFSDKISDVFSSVKEKVATIMNDIMPQIAAKAKVIIQDGKELAKQVGTATLEILKQVGHDALIEAQKWLDENHELVEELLLEFLTETLPKLIKDAMTQNYAISTYGWSDFWEKVGNKIEEAVDKVKETGSDLVDKISEGFADLKEKVNQIIAPIKEKVRIILADIMPKIAEKAKIVIKDAKVLAKQVGLATLEILKQLGHDALIYAQQWLEENHELVEKLLFQFLTETLPKLIKKSLAKSYAVTPYGWSDFWEKVGNAIESAFDKVKEGGAKLADAISEEFDKVKEKINGIIAPVKTKVRMILEEVMPKIIAKAKLVISDAKVIAREVGLATLEILKKLGHDALIEAQKWLDENHELVEDLIFKFLTEQLPKLIQESMAKSYAVTTYGWSDFWDKVGNAIDNVVDKMKEAGNDLKEKVSGEIADLKEKVNQILAPVKEKVRIIMADVMPKIAAKAKIVLQDAKEVAKKVGLATLEILKQLGHDALIEAQKWLEENHEVVEKLIFDFLVTELPKLIAGKSAYMYPVKMSLSVL